MRDAASFFQQTVEDGGWGEVRVLSGHVGARLDEVFLVHTRTFAGDGYVEVYDKDGAPLCSGTTEHGRVDEWDEAFGDVREIAELLVA